VKWFFQTLAIQWQQSSSRPNDATVLIASAASQASCADAWYAFRLCWSLRTTTRWGHLNYAENGKIIDGLRDVCTREITRGNKLLRFKSKAQSLGHCSPMPTRANFQAKARPMMEPIVSVAIDCTILEVSSGSKEVIHDETHAPRVIPARSLTFCGLSSIVKSSFQSGQGVTSMRTDVNGNVRCSHPIKEFN